MSSDKKNSAGQITAAWETDVLLMQLLKGDLIKCSAVETHFTTCFFVKIVFSPASPEMTIFSKKKLV